MTGALAASQYIPSTTINLLMVMVLVWTTGVIFRKIHQPPILGELLAGILFGPCCLGLIMPDPTLRVLSDLGIFFLMFYAGLETNADALKKATGISAYVGTGGFLLPLSLGYAACHLFFGYDHIRSLFVGLGLAITAIAISARLLNDMNLQRFRVTPVILGAAIIDDVLALAFLSTLIGLVANGGAINWASVVIIFTKVFLFFGLTIFIGMKIFPMISEYFSTREAKGFTLSLVVALVYGMLAEAAGLHVIIGAYMAGLFIRRAIASEELFQKINDRFVSITYGFLGPIFFVSLSFHVTFDIFTKHMGLILILLFLATFGKVVGAGLSAYLRKMSLNESIVVGVSMNGRGAVELIIASLGLQFGIIDDSIFSILIVMSFLTTLMSPVTLGLLLRRIHTKGLEFS